MSEWPKETGCKPVGSAYGGSNPSGPTTASGPVDAIYRADVVSGSIEPEAIAAVTKTKWSTALDAQTEAEPASTSTSLLERSTAWADRVVMKLEPYSLGGRMRRREPIPADDWSWLLVPGILGFIAICAIAVGGSFPNSPFKYELAGTWFFGEPGPAGPPDNDAMLLAALVLVYGGLVLLLRTWVHLLRALAVRPAVPVKSLVIMATCWVVPLLIVAPMFSRDVFSYAAQGEMVSHHVNPYLYGPWTLGASTYTFPVDSLWKNAPAPYGPLFLVIDGLFARMSFHHSIVTILWLRALALFGYVLVAIGIPMLAKALGRDPGRAFVLGVLNPLVILSFVSGSHNDALMAGFLVLGFAMAKKGRFWWAITLCVCAAAVKAPAMLGVFYVAWEARGPTASVKQRLKPLIEAGVITSIIFLGLSFGSGLGFGWVKNLASPGTVRSWTAPATGLGMLLSGISHGLGSAIAMTTWISITRVLCELIALGFAIWLFTKVDQIGSVKAVGLSLLGLVILGPVIQPWYLTWGIVVLAALATGRLRTTIVAITVIAPFIGLPGGQALFTSLLHTDPLATAGVLLAMVLIFLCPLGRWTIPLAVEARFIQDDDVFAPAFPRFASPNEAR